MARDTQAGIFSKVGKAEIERGGGPKEEMDSVPLSTTLIDLIYN